MQKWHTEINMTSNTKKVGNPFRKIQFANLTVFSFDKNSVLGAPAGENVEEGGRNDRDTI